MCDYSLHNIASRPAKAGDKLVITDFAHSFTRGFSAIGEPEVAVCLQPGTELAFVCEATCSHPFARILPNFGFGRIGDTVACFRQINDDEPHIHHDALEFSNGRVVLVTQLRVGQHATVLQLPAASPSNQSGTESNEPVSPGMTGEQSSAVGKGLLPVLVESSGRRTR